MKILSNLLKIISKTPLNPNWLWIFKFNQLNDLLLDKYLVGNVLEVGAGSGDRKHEVLSRYGNKVNSYLATDYAGWDEFYEKIKSNKLYMAFNQELEFRKIDEVCSATDLPYDNNNFDCHISFEVLEHIDNPEKYFEEAARVLKKNGIIYLTTPFMYPLHGDPPEFLHDCFRGSIGYYNYIAQKYQIDLVGIESNTGLGTTVSALVNHYLTSIIQKTRFIALKALLATILLPIWTMINILGLIIDAVPDKRFSSRFHIIYKKP